MKKSSQKTTILEDQGKLKTGLKANIPKRTN
jgi:hypothetical protein